MDAQRKLIRVIVLVVSAQADELTQLLIDRLAALLSKDTVEPALLDHLLHDLMTATRQTGRGARHQTPRGVLLLLLKDHLADKMSEQVTVTHLAPLEELLGLAERVGWPEPSSQVLNPRLQAELLGVARRKRGTLSPQRLTCVIVCPCVGAVSPIKAARIEPATIKSPSVSR